jgi:hypothetical protein
MKKSEKKIMLSGDYEDIISIDDHYYLVDKRDKMVVLPYTLDSRALLDKIGVIEDWNYLEEESVITIMSDYISSDDETDLVCANRILFDVIGTNVTSAEKWMYLGSVYSNLTSESPIKIYAVNITEVKIKEDEEVNAEKTAKKFKMMDSSKVLQSDEVLFLASFLRLFANFYVTSLSNNKS